MSGITGVEIDALEAQRQFETLLDQVERGAGFIIIRQDKAVARLVPGQPVAGGITDSSSYDSGMKHADFRLGEMFRCNGQRWRCTDIGTRVITAIRLDHEADPSWYNGPPYGSLLRNRRSWSFCWMEWVLKAWKRPVASIRPLGNATT